RTPGARKRQLHARHHRIDERFGARARAFAAVQMIRAVSKPELQVGIRKSERTARAAVSERPRIRVDGHVFHTAQQETQRHAALLHRSLLDAVPLLLGGAPEGGSGDRSGKPTLPALCEMAE